MKTWRGSGQRCTRINAAVRQIEQRRRRTSIVAAVPPSAVALSGGWSSRAWSRSAEILGALLLEELRRPRYLVQSVHPVLNRDPPGETDLAQDAEDRVVVVRALPRLAVSQRSRVAERAVADRQVVARRPGREEAIRRMHGDDTVLHLLEKADRVVAADHRVGRIVLDAEVRRVDLLDDLEEDVLRLRELRIAPGAVLVVVLHAQHDVAALGMLERPPDAFDRPRRCRWRAPCPDAAAR